MWCTALWIHVWFLGTLLVSCFLMTFHQILYSWRRKYMEKTMWQASAIWSEEELGDPTVQEEKRDKNLEAQNLWNNTESVQKSDFSGHLSLLLDIHVTINTWLGKHQKHFIHRQSVENVIHQMCIIFFFILFFFTNEFMLKLKEDVSKPVSKRTLW